MLASAVPKQTGLTKVDEIVFSVILSGVFVGVLFPFTKKLIN